MSCAWDWLQNLVNVLAVPTFGFLIWQILRAEGAQPPASIGTDIRLLDATRLVESDGPGWAIELSVTAETPGALYDVHCTPLGDATVMRLDAGFAACLMHGDAPVVSKFFAPVGRTMRILVRWNRLSALLNRPVAQAVVLEIESPLPDRQDGLARSGNIYVWHWAAFAGVKRLLNSVLERTHIRGRFRLGRFRKPGSWWKASLPDDILLH